MTDRAPIHLGSGEPMLLLHPFMCPRTCGNTVAPQIAETGRYEVFAPTMAGHNGGAEGPFFLDSASFADDVERRMDALGWDTAHIVGNSLGGWVAFELERRGRARTAHRDRAGGRLAPVHPGEVRDRRQVRRGLPGLADHKGASASGSSSCRSPNSWPSFPSARRPIRA